MNVAEYLLTLMLLLVGAIAGLVLIAAVVAIARRKSAASAAPISSIGSSTVAEYENPIYMGRSTNPNAQPFMNERRPSESSSGYYLEDMK